MEKVFQGHRYDSGLASGMWRGEPRSSVAVSIGSGECERLQAGPDERSANRVTLIGRDQRAPGNCHSFTETDCCGGSLTRGNG